MIRRPNPGETEDDLLEFQRQFLKQSTTSSVTVVSKTGEKRKPELHCCDAKPEARDVVQMEGLPVPICSKGQYPPVKKSRFLVAQDKKAHVRDSSYKMMGPDMILDECDTSAGAVLAKIIERDTRNAKYHLPPPVQLPLPLLIQAQDAGYQVKLQEKRKKSLFAQQFANSPELFGVIKPSTSDRDEIKTKQEEIVTEIASILDGTGLSATFGKVEVQKIHEENLATLSTMSTNEVLEEQRKLLQVLDPKLVEFLKNKQLQKHISTGTDLSQNLDISTLKHHMETNKQKKSNNATTLPIEIQKDWLHMNKAEYDKLEWMKDLPPLSASDSKTGKNARFDFNGNLLHTNADIPVNLGLHHHGDEPERAGYTLEELFQLSSSSNLQQRVLALQTLSKVIKQAKEGHTSQYLQTPIIPSILDAGVVFLFRWSLDDSAEAVVMAAVASLNALIVNHADEQALSKVFNWHLGHRVVCQAAAVPEPVGIKLPEGSEETPQETDADVCKRDIVLALVTRMNLLPRLQFILNTFKPQALYVVAILQMLTRVSRHSTNLAYQVFIQKDLVDLIVSNFLPLSWKLQDSSMPLSQVYGLPLAQAMRLMLTLCQAGRSIAAMLLSKYELEDRLLRYLLIDSRSLDLPLAEAERLQLESYNVWKVCLSYGLGAYVYIEMYPIVIELLSNNLHILDHPVEHQLKLAALVNCLEMAVCMSTSSSTVAGFKQSQDGVSMSVEILEQDVRPSLNWNHTSDLIQPIKLLFLSLLSELAQTYQIKKQSLQLPTVCLNFISTFYHHAQAQHHYKDIIDVMDDMINFYNNCMQNWNSFGLVTMRSRFSDNSNLLQPSELKNTELSSCIPEYGNSCVHEEQLLPVIRTFSPYGFMVAWYRMVYNFSRIHKGILSSGQESSQHTISQISPLITLQCCDLKSYLMKIAREKLGHLANNYFTKFETMLLYYVLKLAILLTTAAYQVDLDPVILHNVGLLNVLTCLQYGDEFLAHDLLSTVLFNPVLFRISNDDMTSAKLEQLKLTEKTFTYLRCATTEEIEFTSEQLCLDALKHLNSIRATYLASLIGNDVKIAASRSHFLQHTLSTESCFTSNIGEPLIPQDWMFMPLIELYNKYSYLGADAHNVLSSAQLDMVRNVLQWIYLLESKRHFVLEGISVTLKISRIMCTFLTSNDMFLDRTVHCYLVGLLQLFTRPSILNKMDFSEPIHGLTSFYDLYVLLLQQYEAVSFGDSVFGSYVLIPLQQRHCVKYRQAIWTEYTGILRTLSLPLSELLIPIEQYLEPEETNMYMIRLYYQSLYSTTLRHCWCPILYLIAIHHVNRFMYTQDGSHKKLKASMMTQILKSDNEELKKHIIFYKQANLTQTNGMELYEQLPAIRQTYIESLKS